MAADPKRTAVVGSGVAGLTAAYVLQRGGHQVSLYEAENRLGGHAHTHDVPASDGRVYHVDSGFIVHNERTYPNLLRLLAELGVATQESEMSMSVRCEGCGLEYAGAHGARGLFAHPRTSLRPRALRMFGQVPRFHRAARALLRRADAAPREAPEQRDRWEASLTLAEFLRRGSFSSYFTSHFMLPLVSAVWSCPERTALRYPALYLFRFLDHHGMLTVTGSPTWRTVTGGSGQYVRRVAGQLAAVHTATPVRRVRRTGRGAELLTQDGTRQGYDAVVIAVHPDQALKLLPDATTVEREVLGAFRYSRNPTQLHTDAGVLPHSPAARASWNYLMPSCDTSADGVRVSYHMNRLQRLDAPEDYLVTLGSHAGLEGVDQSKVLAEMVYEHPVYTPESVSAQRRLPELNGPVTVFAGAYHGWGFHEDGCRAGVEAARALGVRW